MDVCAGPNMALVPQVRKAAKFETACRMFRSLPDQLTKDAGGRFASVAQAF